MPCASLSMLDVPGPLGSSSIENDAHGIKKLLLNTKKNSSKLNKFLYNEVNLLIQYITVQDQDGQNNKIYKFIIHYQKVLNTTKQYDIYEYHKQLPTNTLNDQVHYKTHILLTQSHPPAILTSLLFQTLWTRKQTPSQPVLTEPPSTDNGAHGTEKLPNTQISEDFT